MSRRLLAYPVRWIGWLLHTLRRVSTYFLRAYEKSRFASVGKQTYIGKNGTFTYPTIEIGDDVYIGAGAVFQSSFGKIKIGNHVMFGPCVHIHGGNHKINEVGKLLKHTSDKHPGDDGLIIIEDDCWIGAGAIILSNVVIGKGSVVGAGAIVTSSIPPYSVYTGAPDRKLRPRFDEQTLAEHIRRLEEQAHVE